MTSPDPADVPVGEYCREIEAYLCRRNDGHLIRIVGPAFDLVSGWAHEGVPLRIVLHGIDRAVDRRARKAPQRRPLRIEFCEADVQDAFDEWRRAVGVSTAPKETAAVKTPPLATHLERVLRRLTNARATNTLGPELDPLIDSVSEQLDHVRAAGRGLKGDKRQAITTRLDELDARLLAIAKQALSEGDAAAIAAQANTELAPFRDRMAPEVLARAREAAVDRLVRDRFSIPLLTFV